MPIDVPIDVKRTQVVFHLSKGPSDKYPHGINCPDGVTAAWVASLTCGIENVDFVGDYYRSQE